MPQPYDYSLNVASPFDSVMRGVQTGVGLRQIADEREQAEAQRQAQAQMHADLAEASQDISKLPGVMVRYPQLAEKLKHGWDTMSSQQQQSTLQHGGEVLSALAIGRGDVAAQALRDRATALRNSGDDQGAKLHEAMAEAAEKSPDMLKQATAYRLAAVPGGDKVIEGITKLAADRRAEETQPAAVKEANAKAESAAVSAKFAESKAVGELNLNAANIAHLAADTEIAKQNSRIAAMNAATNREGNAIKREELQAKLNEAITARDEKVRTKVAEVRQGAATLDNLLNTVEQLKKHPALDTVVGPLAGKDYYPHTLAGMSTAGTVGLVPDAGDRADAIALIDQLQSQAALSQLQSLKNASATGSSGFGALSEKELAIIENGMQSLKRTQSPKAFHDKLDELARLMKKNRDILVDKVGVDPGKPDTPAAPGARPPLSSFGGG